MKKSFCILAVCMLCFCCLACAEAKTVRPLEIDPAGYDLASGEFCAGVENAESIPEGHFTLTLALEDRYAAEEIAELEPGDTVIVGGKEYTVELVVIHGEYDEDGDGEYDSSGTTVRNAEQFRDVMDRLEIVITEDAEIIPEAYEVCAKDEYSSIAFLIVSETECLVQVDDCTLFTPVGSVEVTLPLPDGFVCYDYSGGEEGGPLTAEEFIRRVTDYSGFNPYNTTVVMENGRPVRIDHSDYPEGPEE